jgi:hypothetical protein
MKIVKVVKSILFYFILVVGLYVIHFGFLKNEKVKAKIEFVYQNF